MKKQLSFLILSFYLINAYTQNDISKNAIHASLGTIIMAATGHVTYDRLVIKTEKGLFKSYYATLKAGKSAVADFTGNNSGSGTLTNIGLTGLTGKGIHHFELSFGLGYFIDGYPDEIYEEPRIDGNIVVEQIGFENDNRFYPYFSIGYRKQMAKGFLIRTGIGIGELVYFGLGYSF